MSVKGGGSVGSFARSIIRTHWPLLVVLAFGAGIRVAVAVAYRPALLWTDSWSYLNLAYSRFPVGVSGWQPSGYPLFIRIVTLPARSLFLITTVQHLLGLATAVLVYVLAGRLGAGRALATVAAAATILEAYTIRLEQTISSEPLFTLLLVVAILVAVSRDDRVGLTATGLLLAAAVLVRVEGVIALPIWLLYVLWRRRSAGPLTVAVASAGAPLLAYAVLHAAVGAGFGLVDDSGWLLYGRVGEIAAPCNGLGVTGRQRVLCEHKAPAKHRHDPDWYVWNGSSPARRLYGYDNVASEKQLRSFALKVIRDRPGPYARIVARGVVDYLLPGRADIPTEIRFPRPSQMESMTAFSTQVRTRYFPNYQRRARSPSTFVREYAAVFHMREWLVLCLFLIPAAALGAAARSRISRIPEVLFLAVLPLAVLVGAVATNGPSFRFFVPMLPLLFADAAVSIRSLVRLRLGAAAAVAGTLHAEPHKGGA